MFRVFYSLKIEGRENIPDEQVIFIANHVSIFDTLVLLNAIPLKQRLKTYVAGAKDYFFEGIGSPIGFFGRIILNAFVFSRGSNIKQSLKDFGKVINKGGNVLIYPEGTRSRDGKLAPFKSGIGLMTWNVEVPIVPIKIEGLYKVLPVGNKFPKHGNVIVKIGKPLRFSKMKSINEITTELHDALRDIK